MCFVSAVGDSWSKRVPEKYPWVQTPPQTWPITAPTITIEGQVTREEFEALREEIEELRKLLLAAKEFDAATGQPDCEMDEKVGLIKRLADLVGVDLDDVFASSDTYA